ncbi:hypothetical protein NQ318_017896 [Aromia moschata]|uniref:Fibronectin type-III domain-containing protein n=1 Tax=Aromia moschata TaxID=1265417 RepID=A0AAV8YB38_9CUCU|nr:hypothetical protein NQ318_017896 [Aromia moschata]
MVNKVLFLVVPVLSIAFVQILGENCQPLGVNNISLDPNSTLHWSPDADDDCPISYYLVHVHDAMTIEFNLMVEETYVSVDFLPVCEAYRFSITPVSTNNISGVNTVVFMNMPLPSDANLTVGLFMVSEENESVTLRWVMASEWRQCANRFRVIIWDEDDDYVYDEYTWDTTINITHLKPCTHYTFGVVALYNIVQEGPVTTVRRQISDYPISPPTLTDVNMGSTTAELTWQLQGYTENRCEVTSLEVRSFLNVSLPIEDSPGRLPVTLSLTDLQPNNIYILNVTVVNVAGPSAPVVIAIQTFG